MFSPAARIRRYPKPTLQSGSIPQASSMKVRRPTFGASSARLHSSTKVIQRPSTSEQTAYFFGMATRCFQGTRSHDILCTKYSCPSVKGNCTTAEGHSLDARPLCRPSSLGRAANPKPLNPKRNLSGLEACSYRRCGGVVRMLLWSILECSRCACQQNVRGPKPYTGTLITYL